MAMNCQREATQTLFSRKIGFSGSNIHILEIQREKEGSVEGERKCIYPT